MTTATPAHSSTTRLPSPSRTDSARSPTFRPSRTSMSSDLATSPPRRVPPPPSSSSPRSGAINGIASGSGSQRTGKQLPRGHDSSDVAALSSSLEDARLDSWLLPPARHARTAIETSLDRAVAAAGQSHTQASAASNWPSTSKGAPSASSHEAMPSSSAMDSEPMGPFEGPEKLLEVWFADSKDDVEGEGLLQVDRRVWEEMLDIVKCKVLSVIKGHAAVTYLLSESSMFIFPHKLILKTCGTTTLLLGLERLLMIAFDALKPSRSQSAEHCSQVDLGKLVKRCFYSRKSFMFPERQKGPHRDWLLEVSLLDQFFEGGAAYTVGKMNGNHWLLYMTSPPENVPGQHNDSTGAVQRPLRLPSLSRRGPPSDETLEILMTHLSPASCARFEFPDSLPTPSNASIAALCKGDQKDRGHLLGAELCQRLSLSSLFEHTSLDAFAFEPCGFSANALISRAPGAQDKDGSEALEDGYWTVHVTPESDSSYASFETNACSYTDDAHGKSRGLPWLISRVLTIFEPSRLSVTLFTSSTSPEDGFDDHERELVHGVDDIVSLSDNKSLRGASLAQSSQSLALSKETNAVNATTQDPGDVLHALQLKGYRRTDRIAYEFEDYDLVFVSFDKIGASLPRH